MKISNTFLFIFLFTILFLIFFNVSSFATTFTYEGVNGSAFSQTDVNDIEACFNSVKGTSIYYLVCVKSGQNARMVVFDNYDPPKFCTDQATHSYILSTASMPYRAYWLLGNGQTQYISSFNNTFTNSMPFSYSNNLPYVYGNLPIYTDSYFTSGFWCPSGYSDLIPPVIENFEFTNVVNSMVAGEYEDIIVIGNDYWDTPILFTMNNGSIIDTDPNKQISIILDENSPFVLPNSRHT